MPMIIDGDTHLFEPVDMWATHADPGDRALALAIERDELGDTWLTFQDRRIHPAEVQRPGDLTALGDWRRRRRAGEPAPVDYADALPDEYWDPDARVARLDTQGIDAAIAFPNFGLFWMRSLADRPDAIRVNLTAWNRWAAEIAASARGRLRPVGHVVLDDPEWLDAQLAYLARHGITAAMLPAAPVGGLPLSHPSLDGAWSAFERHGVSAVFHVSDFARPFDDAWYSTDVNPVEPLLMSMFIATPPMLALTDLAVGGVLARHPDLRIGLVEFMSAWLPGFLRTMDTCVAFHRRSNGLDDTLELTPSEYVRRQVRVATFGFERPADLAREVGDVFLFGSDWPHAEGLARPLEDFTGRGGPPPSPETEGLYRANAQWLLHDR